MEQPCLNIGKAAIEDNPKVSQKQPPAGTIDAPGLQAVGCSQLSLPEDIVQGVRFSVAAVFAFTGILFPCLLSCLISYSGPCKLLSPHTAFGKGGQLVESMHK